MKNKRYSCHPGNNKGFWSSVPGTRPGDKAKCIFYYTAGQGWWQGIEGHLRSTTLCLNRLKLACYLTQNDGILSGCFPITYLENAAAVHPHSHKSRLPASQTHRWIYLKKLFNWCVCRGGRGRGRTVAGQASVLDSGPRSRCLWQPLPWSPPPRRPQGSAFLNLTVFIMSLLTLVLFTHAWLRPRFCLFVFFCSQTSPWGQISSPTHSIILFWPLFFSFFFLQSNLAKKQCLGLTVAFGIIISPGLAWQLPWDLLLASCLSGFPCLP